MNSPLIIWQFSDGKPGHQNQSTGLINCLAEFCEIHKIRIPVHKYNGVIRRKILQRKAERYGKPDLIIGAGHRTHSAILNSKRRFGGKSVVIMKPSLPMSFFDICLVPQHDGVSESDTCIPTKGALNKVTPSTSQDHSKGLFLIGGPAKAYNWDNAAILKQLNTILDKHSKIQWTMTNSRRTPESFLEEVIPHIEGKINFIPHQKTDSSWVPRSLAESSKVWVSEDSTSMVYESLTAGSQVGLLEVPYKTKPGRIAKGIHKLQEEGALLSVAEIEDLHAKKTTCFSLNESQRCAEVIYKKFFAGK